MPEQTYRKKLIEVDLPLNEINTQSRREKNIAIGHPATLHTWWAPRPLAACRAVIFASMVDDPSSCPEEFPTPAEQQAERQRLHDLIKRLTVWRDSNNAGLLAEARYEIARSVARSLGQTAPTDPAGVLDYLRTNALPIYDPFAGRGSIPLEAQRLGLKAIASDLNPVAVLINKALIELPPRFANQPPVNPDADPLGMTTGKGKKAKQIPWRGAAGLADDIRYYGRWMRERAFERIGHLYPKAKLSDGSEATVIAWLWARTIPCPNPECAIPMPLLRRFQITTKKTNRHWMKPSVNRDQSAIEFTVQDHDHDVPTAGTAGAKGVVCIACGGSSPLTYVREQAKRGAMKAQLITTVVEGDRQRVFLPPTPEHATVSAVAAPDGYPHQAIPKTPKIAGLAYGMNHWHQLFTNRQLTALTTFCTLLVDVHELMKRQGASEEYANALCTYLAFAIDKSADAWCSFARWQSGSDKVAPAFARQAIPMVWDFAEANIFSNSSRNWMAQIDYITAVVEGLPTDVNSGEAHQADATTTIHGEGGPIIVTDPPYYDNINYADVADFFYVWLRESLRDIYPSLFTGMLTPKQEEMIANPIRFERPREHFKDLLHATLQLIRERCSPEFPSSIFYAYKQQEEEEEGLSSTGWDTMLTALVSTGFQIVGTWPMRTERSNRANAMQTNSLSSSVVLVCRPRTEDARSATRREFLTALSDEMPDALKHLTRENHIAPVDLAQAAIGPGMEIYSRYSRVETIGGDLVPVREALAAINRVIAEYDKQQQGELDEATRFCLDWLEQHGYDEGEYGDAEQLARAKNASSIDALAAAGLVRSGSNRVSLIQMEDYDHSLEASSLLGMTAWEGCLRIAWHLGSGEGRRGVAGAAQVARAMEGNVESVERLARILYNHYDRRGDSSNAVLFNTVVVEWPAIVEAMDDPEQGQMLGRT